MSSQHLKQPTIDEKDRKLATLAELLGVKRQESGEFPFMIVDADEERGLYLVHYNPDTIGSEVDPRVRALRGVLVDINAGPVRKTNGYTPIAVAPEEGLTASEDGWIDIRDVDGMRHHFPITGPNAATFVPHYEGVVMFVTRTNGVTDFGTYRKIDGSKSWYGDSEHFTSLYQKYGGPDEEQLFDVSKPHSSICHSFLIVDRSLFKSSKQDLKDRTGFLVYLGLTQQYRRADDERPSVSDLDVTKYNPDDVDWDYNNSWFSEPANFIRPTNVVGRNPFIDPDSDDFTRTQIQTDIELDIVNQILTYGYHPELISKSEDRAPGSALPDDSRLMPGESVICRYYGVHGPVLIQIVSKAYEWREMMTGNNFSLMSRACNLLEMASLPRELSGGHLDHNHPDDHYEESFPIVAAPSVADLYSASASSKVTPLILPSPDWGHLTRSDLYSGDGKRIRDVIDRRYNNALICYALSVPLHRQEAVFLLHEEIKKGRQKVIDFIVVNEESLLGQFIPNKNKKKQNSYRHFSQIAKQARSYIKQKRQFDAKSSNEQLFRTNVATLVNREWGNSLFQSIRQVTAAETEEAEAQ